MYWANEIANIIIRRNPDKEVYTCACGISPSGSIHFGNFRDIATTLEVAKALERLGRKVRILFSWDDFDRLRKIPENVAAVRPDYEQYVGRPYVDVPNPFDSPKATYAAYFENEFMNSIRPFKIDLDYKFQAVKYRNGDYREHVITALRKRGEIFDILSSFRTQEELPGEREAYYPVSIYCPHCGKDTTIIKSLSQDCTIAEYECSCGHRGRFDFTRDFNCKLAWKIDWPMRWMYEGVDFEPGGKDHASPGGSYDTSSVIARRIFGIEPPVFQGYEFVGIKGTTGKMSGSSGLNLTPATLLKIYPPEMVLWLYFRSEPTRGFDFCFDEGILRQYAEFDRMYNAYITGTCDERTRIIMENSLISDRKICTVPMNLIVQLGSIVNFNVPMMEIIFRKIGMNYTAEDFAERLELARFWLEKCSPENENRLLTAPNADFYATLTIEEQQEVSLLCSFLRDEDYTLEELQTRLYDIPRAVYGDATNDRKLLKNVQSRFFRIVYRLLLGKDSGPRLYLFLGAFEKEVFIPLLTFGAHGAACVSA